MTFLDPFFHLVADYMAPLSWSSFAEGHMSHRVQISHIILIRPSNTVSQLAISTAINTSYRGIHPASCPHIPTPAKATFSLTILPTRRPTPRSIPTPSSPVLIPSRPPRSSQRIARIRRGGWRAAIYSTARCTIVDTARRRRKTRRGSEVRSRS